MTKLVGRAKIEKSIRSFVKPYGQIPFLVLCCMFARALRDTRDGCVKNLASIVDKYIERPEAASLDFTDYLYFACEEYLRDKDVRWRKAEVVADINSALDFLSGFWLLSGVFPMVSCYMENYFGKGSPVNMDHKGFITRFAEYSRFNRISICGAAQTAHIQNKESNPKDLPVLVELSSNESYEILKQQVAISDAPGLDNWEAQRLFVENMIRDSLLKKGGNVIDPNSRLLGVFFTPGMRCMDFVFS